MKHISAAAVVLLCAAAGYSQDNAIKKDSGKLDIPLFLNLKNPPSQGVFDLGDVSKIAPSAELSGVYTSAELGKKEITEGNISSVADALDKVSGVATYKNTRGEQIFTLRGFTEFQVPVMVDGIPIYVPYGDQIDTAKLPLYNVSKITVTKGMSSVLNGPNTMGGAVNIITKKPVKAFEASGDASFAGVSDRDVNVNLGTKMEKFYFTAAGEYADTKGFKLSKDFTPTAVETGGIRSNSDEIRRNFSAKLGFTPSEDHEYAVAANIVSGVFGVPPNASDTRTKYWRFNDWTKNTYYMVGKSRFGGLSLGSKLYYDSYYNVLDAYDNANYNTQRNRSSFHSTYDDHSVGFGVTPTMSFLDGMTTLAGAFSYKDDVHKQQGTAGAAWEKYEAELYSAGAENSWQFQNGLTATAGLSYDIQKPRYSNGGALRAADTAANPQAGLKYEFSDAVQVYGNAGLKSRFPTLKELYSGYMDTKVPNPDLKKEAASNYEIGTRLYSEEAK
ncbi:MAG: TonB-dependent receptor, partial [Elusimicrobiaceae bacterium]